MAAHSLHPLHHPLITPHPHHFPHSDSSPFSLLLKPSPSPPHKLSSHFTPFSNSLTVSTSPSLSFDLLWEHLSSQNFRDADEESRRLLILLAGESAVQRGYVFFSEVQFISGADLRTIDRLWRESSGGRFGYSVQRRIWGKCGRDFTRFFIKVGWMKKLETEVQQYNYRAFPEEFLWEMKDETPEGHLPLTNALRGTQLLNSILTHPAFEAMEEDEGEDVKTFGGEESEEREEGRASSKPALNRTFKPDYSF